MINEGKMERTMLNLGFSEANSGTDMLRTAIRYYYEAKDPMKIIYADVAKAHHSTSGRVERAMRHAIEVAWIRGGGEVQFDVFGYSINPETGKPTVSEFIARMARYCGEN